LSIGKTLSASDQWPIVCRFAKFHLFILSAAKQTGPEWRAFVFSLVCSANERKKFFPIEPEHR